VSRPAAASNAAPLSLEGEPGGKGDQVGVHPGNVSDPDVTDPLPACTTQERKRREAGPVNEDEFAALYRQHRSALVWYLRCHGAGQPEAADAVQDAFACALAAADQIRDQRAWPAWLRTVAMRCYLRALARRGGPQTDETARVSVLTMADVPDVAEPAGPDTSETRHQEELVLSLLSGLPPQQRRVFALYYEGWATAEIAAHLGMDQAAVRQNITRARAALRRSIMEHSAPLGGSS
jgi:RNA polymerase sigma factor (sigma-70 family)